MRCVGDTMSGFAARALAADQGCCIVTTATENCRVETHNSCF